MTLSRSEVQIEWSSADYKDITAGSTETSDAATLQSAVADVMVQCKADNQAGSAADGDYLLFYAAYTLGDPDGSGSDEYPTDVDNMDFLCSLDTYNADAESKIVKLPNCKGVKIVATNYGSSNTIRASATILQWYVS